MPSLNMTKDFPRAKIVPVLCADPGDRTVTIRKAMGDPRGPTTAGGEQTCPQEGPYRTLPGPTS